jgi:hypothetical protein
MKKLMKDIHEKTNERTSDEQNQTKKSMTHSTRG